MPDCFILPNAAELVEETRLSAEYIARLHGGEAKDYIPWKAADVIEQLLSENAKLKAAAVNWHQITTRLLTDEENEWYAEQGYEPWEMPEFIYDCDMPEDGQEILIATPWGTDKDICSNDAEYGIGLEGRGDFVNVFAWAELPQYKEVDNG